MSSADLPKVPPVEQPPPAADDSLEQLEENTLDKQARSAAYRAVVEHSQHLSALNARIDVLQSKLDRREEELHRALPRIAELEQAGRAAKVEAAVEVLAVGGGAFLLGIASFMEVDWAKYLLLGLGAAASVVGLSAKLLFALFGQPPNNP